MILPFRQVTVSGPHCICGVKVTAPVTATFWSNVTGHWSEDFVTTHSSRLLALATTLWYGAGEHNDKAPWGKAQGAENIQPGTACPRLRGKRP